LLKPIVFARFFKAIEKFRAIRQDRRTDGRAASRQDSRAANRQASQAANLSSGSDESTSKIKTVRPADTNKYIFVRKDRKQIKVILDDVLYVQSLKDYIKIHMVDQTHIVKQSISAFAEELGDDFIRVHRSYLVNKGKVTAYTKHDIEIGEIEIPIGDSYKEKLSKQFT
jgi:DNA-binding LytR/AlgR family response regulator